MSTSGCWVVAQIGDHSPARCVNAGSRRDEAPGRPDEAADGPVAGGGVVVLGWMATATPTARINVAAASVDRVR